ncbi:MAG: hypothetical protein WAM66_09855 [Acidobacteriaceae bacterium]
MPSGVTMSLGTGLLRVPNHAPMPPDFFQHFGLFARDKLHGNAKFLAGSGNTVRGRK